MLVDRSPPKRLLPIAGAEQFGRGIGAKLRRQPTILRPAALLHLRRPTRKIARFSRQRWGRERRGRD